MKRFQHLVVNLSLNESDAALLNWTSRLARLAGAKRVSVLHAWQPVEIPAELRERYPWLLEPGEEVARERIDQLVAEHLVVDGAFELEKTVVQGSAFGEVLRVTVEGGADLVVCGRSPEEIQLGERLARKAPCSVLSVPADASPGFQRILAPVDYSAFSRQALDVALAFAQAGGVKLTAMHAFEVHWGHGRSALSREEFVADLREFHERRLREFVDETGRRGVEVEYLVRESALPGAAIADEVARGGHDLVVVGCRGHDAIYATLLGSTAENILQTCPAPVVAVKQKVADDTFLATLRRLWE